MRRFPLIKYLGSIVAASLLGALLGFLLYKTAGSILTGFNIAPEKDRNTVLMKPETATLEPHKVETGVISYNKFTAPKNGKSIYIDTEAGILSLYRDGRIVDSLTITSLSPNPPLVAGEYKVTKKELSHRSSRTGAILENTVAFAPSYFTYAVTAGRGGKITPESVGLSKDDSKKVFSFADLDTKVVVASPKSLKDTTREERDILGFSKPALNTADLQSKIRLKAEAFTVKDLDTGENILNKNEAGKFPIASVTKIVTAIVALDNLQHDDMVKISKKALETYGQQGNLRAGESFSVIDLVNCLLLESSNDAAEVLAEHLGRDLFISKMNELVRSLGMSDTVFRDPSGLSKGNLSTPRDLSKLIEHVERKRLDILTITEGQSHTAVAGTSGRRVVWLNRNRLIRDNSPYYLWGKDGFTGEALMTFAGAFSVPFGEFDHKRFSVALLRSNDRVGDVKKIIDQIINSFRYEDGLSFKTIFSKRKSSQVKKETPKNLSLLFVGDIMLDRGVKQLIEKRGGSDYMFPFEFVPFLKEADILFGNLEGPVSDKGYEIGNLYSFRMNPKAIPALKEAGFDVLSVANNHVGDWGLTAFEDTIKNLRGAGMLVAGGGLNGKDAKTVKIIEKEGIKIGFLGFSDVGPDWLAGSNDMPGILLANDPSFETIISGSSKKVDYLVVSFHFGNEYEPKSNKRQQELAHKAVDAGAKIVVGHHPHVIQEVERYKDGVIAYSLGNFIFDQGFSEETMTGAILEIILDKKGFLQINQSNVRLNDAFQPVLAEED